MTQGNPITTPRAAGVLEALQYVSPGQGILAGVAILFCAMRLDKTVQGRNR